MNKNKAMAWFIIIIMVLSVAGFVGSSFFAPQDITKKEYNGYPFLEQSGQWQVKINTQNYVFQNYPLELENLSSPDIPPFSSSRVYLGFIPNDTVIAGPQVQFLASIMSQNGIYPQQACVIEQGCPDIPLVNCANPTIIMRSGVKNTFSTENNCTTLQAPDNVELQKMTERLIYKFLGVMN